MGEGSMAIAFIHEFLALQTGRVLVCGMEATIHESRSSAPEATAENRRLCCVFPILNLKLHRRRSILDKSIS
jgi:hypothetical protein